MSYATSVRINRIAGTDSARYMLSVTMSDGTERNESMLSEPALLIRLRDVDFLGPYGRPQPRGTVAEFIQHERDHLDALDADGQQHYTVDAQHVRDCLRTMLDRLEGFAG